MTPQEHSGRLLSPSVKIVFLRHKQRDLLLSRTEMVQNQETKLVEKIFQLQEEARKLHNKKDKLQSSYDLWKTKKIQHEQIMEQQKLQIERREKELEKKRKELQVNSSQKYYKCWILVFTPNIPHFSIKQAP